MKSVSTFSTGSLAGTSYQADDISRLFKEHFDLLIVVPSWDERCTAITRTNIESRMGMMIKLSRKDSVGKREAHETEIVNYINAHSDEVVPIEGDSLDPRTLWLTLEGHIRDLARNLGRPLSVVLEGSTCPRYLSLALLGSLLLSGIVHSISISYVEAEYPVKHPADLPDGEIAFRGGVWRSVPIPGLEGRYEPGRRRFYLVSVGFEGVKTLRAVMQADPDRVSVLYPDPGYLQSYRERTQRDNAVLIKRFKIPEDQIIRAAAGDAIGAWKALHTRSVERPDHENSYFLCCGTKPHSFALALRAATLQTPAVLYQVPEERKIVYIKSGSVNWRFDVRLTSRPV